MYKLLLVSFNQYHRIETEEEICPEFAQEIGNVTQALGRDARLECVVDNLGRFRYMDVKETILKGESTKKYRSTQTIKASMHLSPWCVTKDTTLYAEQNHD
ncbi:hypothetical protein TNCT_221031 [Trichonephila clavata]|uniref:Uncharacterized protein n=1 Tax=Trichonephila clavata TaxID=2740835 RepID=A0A8X6LX79_TRICU|nr:hypothetical protein TNCT_221031 [Trichonephila clavata]